MAARHRVDVSKEGRKGDSDMTKRPEKRRLTLCSELVKAARAQRHSTAMQRSA